MWAYGVLSVSSMLVVMANNPKGGVCGKPPGGAGLWNSDPSRATRGTSKTPVKRGALASVIVPQTVVKLVVRPNEPAWSKVVARACPMRS